MKKDNCHDYVSEAFRYYALCGCPNGEELRKLRLNAADTQRPAVQDLEAVGRVIDRLRSEPDGVTSIRCMEIIYFTQPKICPSRGVMTGRVIAASNELCLSESAIYRILRRLRWLLAVERGLRIDSSVYGVNVLASGI